MQAMQDMLALAEPREDCAGIRVPCKPKSKVAKLATPTPDGDSFCWTTEQTGDTDQSNRALQRRVKLLKLSKRNHNTRNARIEVCTHMPTTPNIVRAI